MQNSSQLAMSCMLYFFYIIILGVFKLHYIFPDFIDSFSKCQYIDLILSSNFKLAPHLNLHPREVVSRCRDPQLQVCGNYFA